MENTSKRVIISNRIFIAFQIVLTFTDIVFSFIFDSSAFIVLFFFHAVLFILYSIAIQSIVEYKIVRKKYPKLTQNFRTVFGYIKWRNKVYKTAKANEDTLIAELVTHEFFSEAVFFFNLIAMIILLYVMHPEFIG